MTADEFDPYAAWLKIARFERPIDHYRLLGLNRFESNPEVISQTADQRMAHVRTFQMGPRGALTQNILNELATAKLCLLDPVSKSAYDQALLDQAAPGQAESEELSPSSPYVPPPPPVHPTAPPVTPPPVTPPPAAPSTAESGNRADQDARSVAEAEDEPGFWRWAPIWVVAAAILAATVGLMVRELLVVESKPPPPAQQIGAGEEAIANSDPEPVVIHQEGSGEVNFPLSVAQLEGENVRRISRHGELLVHGWAASSDALLWRFRLSKPGIYRVEITYATEQDAVGSRVALAVDDNDRPMVFELRSQGSSDRFFTDFDFLAIPRGGVHTLKLQPLEMTGKSLMVLKSLRMLPKQI